MAALATCPRCGAKNPSNAPAGLCPQCLLRLALEANLPMSVAGKSAPTADSTVYRPDSEDRHFVRATSAGSMNAAESGVMHALDQAIGPVPRVLLRDHEADDLRLVRPSSEKLPELVGDSSRYHLSGEIARGGMGVIFRGYDVDLGRDLAVKVILEQHCDRPDMIRRFAVEAQIGGQLQHPGIVPVYEIGQFNHGRLYIAMKLVKGRTLAAFLALRKDPADERARFLSVFEQVCQTMAYAHSRGVVHRDLKPSNVMLGDFGEVQVMDWGLAKVLDRGWATDDERSLLSTGDVSSIRTLRSGSNTSESRTGSVLGTPAYMAPEQARGALDTLDERADVFGLGSILCEILTGVPAYSGKSSDELYRKAERADLADALARLDSCGAESELIVLAKSCLAPAAKDRPQNAAGVLSRVTGYLEGVQLRLKAAGLAQAQAEARAIEERKRRILTVALAASILMIGLLGGGGWAWVAREQAARDEKTARAQAQQKAMLLREFTDAIDQTVRDFGQARLVPADQAKWAVALQSAKRAEALLPRHNSDADQRRRVETLLAQITGEQNAAASVGKDLRMVERLNKIHDDLGVHLEAARANDEWSQAFREYGVDIDHLDPVQAGDRLQTTQVAVELAGMLDQWTFVRRFQLHDDPGAQRLVRIAMLADPDPWRNRLRDTLNTAVTNRDQARRTLEQLADLADAETLPAASVTRLAFALSHLGNRALAISLLKRTQRVHPNGFWVNCDLGRELKESGQYDEAIRFFSVAVAVRPRSELALTDLGKTLQKGGRLEEAAATIRRAIQVREDDPWAHIALGAVLLQLGQKSAASAEFHEAKSLDSKDWFIRIMIADTLSSHGDWDAAIAEFHEAIRDDPHNAFAHDKLGMTLFDMGRIDDAILEFQEAIRLMRRPFPPVYGNLGRALLAKGDFPGAIKALRKAVEPTRHSFSFRSHGFDRTLEQTERMAALEKRLPALLRGDDHPGDPTDCTDSAKLCRIKQHYAASARLWSQAFAKRPELASDIRAGDRFSAACSAAMAGTAQPNDDPAPTEADCRKWRRQALDWLSADLAAYAVLIKDERPANREWVRKRLAEWQVVPSLAGIRDEPAVSSLPESERQAYGEFWSRVDRLQKETAARASPDQPPA